MLTWNEILDVALVGVDRRSFSPSKLSFRNFDEGN